MVIATRQQAPEQVVRERPSLRAHIEEFYSQAFSGQDVADNSLGLHKTARHLEE